VARLTAKQQKGIAPLGRYITTHGPSKARLLNAAGPFLAHPVFSNEKAWQQLNRDNKNIAVQISSCQTYFLNHQVKKSYVDVLQSKVSLETVTRQVCIQKLPFCICVKKIVQQRNSSYSSSCFKTAGIDHLRTGGS